MNDFLGIAWLVVLLIFNAFFVGGEFAVISARRSQIEPRAEAGQKSAKTALYAMENATLMLATSQLGITVCSLLILWVSEPAIHHLLTYPLDFLRLPAAAQHTVAFIFSLVFVSYLHVVFGEVLPKNAAFAMPDRAILLLAPPLVAISRILGPVIAGLNALANGVLRIFGVQPQSEANSTFTLDQVESIVKHSASEGILVDRSGALSGAFEFTEKTARDLTMPLDRVIVLPSDTTPAQVEQAVAKHGFSRYLIAGVDGELEGYVHIKDLLRVDAKHMDRPLQAKRVREMVTIVDTTDLEDLLALMQARGFHLARCCDKTGKQLGVVFLEDVLEILIGEVHDATRRQWPSS